ncbi:MAG: SRPBCC family protein [Streptosporangiaceae bacterium]
MSEDNVVEVSLFVAARPETVYPYFIDPARYVLWMGSDAALDPVPGGVYRVRMSGGAEAVGEFVELDPPHRLVFTWGWNHDPGVPPGTSRVVITLVEENGGTRVLLRHHDLPDADQRDHHKKGWDAYLSRLHLRIQGLDPGPDPN